MTDKLIPRLRFEGFTDAWEQRKVKEVCKISTGKSNTQDKIADGKYPFYVRSAIIETSDKYLYDEEAVLTVGDGVGTGKVYHLVNGKYDLHQRVYRMFDFNDNVNINYFFYFFSTNFYRRVQSMTAKTSVDSVRLEMIADMKILYPINEEQMKIGNFFKLFDETITLQERQLELLKEQKKGFLQKMFPKENEKVPELRFEGFTDDWEQRKVSEITNFHKQGYYTKESYSDDKKYYLLRGTEMTSNKIILDETPKINATDKDYEDFKVQIGDFLIVRSGTVGTYGIVYNDIKAIFGSYLINFRFAQNIVKNEFFGLFYQSDLFKSQLNKIIQQSSNININAENIKSTIITLPSIDEQTKIGNFFKQLDETITLQERKLEEMKEMKKGFLQKMFI